MIAFCVNRPIAVSMAFLACALVGAISFFRLRVSLFPEIAFPRLIVVTAYANASPSEVENLVTRPLEEALGAAGGVERVRSVSREGLSIITVDLAWGEKLDRASLQVRQKLDMARPLLPRESEDSLIVKHDPADEPVLVLSANPTGLPYDQLRDFLEADVRPHLERIPGIASVSIQGGMRREIFVEPNARTLRALGLGLSDLAGMLESAAHSFPIGHVREGPRELTVRYEADFRNRADIGRVLLRGGNSAQPLALRDVVDIRDGFGERRGSALWNGQPAVLLALRKEPSGNMVLAARQARAALDELNRRFARELRFQIIQDNSLVVSNAISSVAGAGMLGILIAFLVLLVFLRELWPAIVISICIPTAVLFTFVCMFALGISVNVMSLGGLSLGIGMLVDNAIVVMESIALESKGDLRQDRLDASIIGTRRVATSVLAATLTSVVVFLPVVFVSGLAGAIFRDLALTVTASLAASLVTAMTLVPMLAAHRPMQSSRAGKYLARGEQILGPVFDWCGRLVERLQLLLDVWVRASLQRPIRFCVIATLLSAAALILLWSLPRSLFPSVDSGVVVAEVALPPGTKLTETEALVSRLSAQLAPFVKHSVSSVGQHADDPTALLEGLREPNASKTFFYLDPAKISSEDFARRLQALLFGLNLTTRIEMRGDVLQDVLGGGSSIRIRLEATERAELRKATLAMRAELQNRFAAWKKARPEVEAPGLEEQPESRYLPTRDAIAAAGLSPSAVARELQSAVTGVVPAHLREGDRRFAIRVRLPPEEYNRTTSLETLALRNAEGEMIDLGSLLARSSGQGPIQVMREDQKRVDELLIPTHRHDADDIVREAESALASLRSRLPEGVHVRVSRGHDEALASLRGLFFAFVLSATLIYMVLAGQFESLLHPFSLAAALPLMLVGAGPALLLTGKGIDISSIIGLVLSAGLVVNAGIVLYERIQQERAKNDRAPLPLAIQEAVRVRFRPILLTTLTTLLGMLPVALAPSSGGSLQGAMAVTVIGALLAGTLLTIIVFPALYSLIEEGRFASTRSARAPRSRVLSHKLTVSGESG